MVHQSVNSNVQNSFKMGVLQRMVNDWLEYRKVEAMILKNIQHFYFNIR